MTGFSTEPVWALHRTTLNYALFLNPKDVIPAEGIMLFADAPPDKGAS